MWTDADGVDNVERVIEVIRETNADVVSLVEVDEPWGKPSKLNKLAESLGYHWAFVPAFEYREAGGFGNAVLARQPLETVQQWQLLPPMLYDGSEPTEPRAVVLAQLQSANGPIVIGSTHFPRHNEELRKHASARLHNLLQELGDRYLICGDFNQPPSAWVPAGLSVAPNPAIATYPTHEPNEPIDYAIAHGVAINAASTINSNASDHLPILIAAED